MKAVDGDAAPARWIVVGCPGHSRGDKNTRKGLLLVSRGGDDVGGGDSLRIDPGLFFGLVGLGGLVGDKEEKDQHSVQGCTEAKVRRAPASRMMRNP